MMIRLRTALASAALAVAAGGIAGAMPAAGEGTAATTPYQVCGPRGCAAHATSGTITWGAAGGVSGSTYDRGPGATVVRIVAYRGGSVIGTFSQRVDEGSVPYQRRFASPDQVRVSVCDATTQRCESQTYRPN
jgi:hypothetical protein